MPAEETLKELERPKLPGELAEMSGAVLYPDEVTSKWDNEGNTEFPHKKLLIKTYILNIYFTLLITDK